MAGGCFGFSSKPHLTYKKNNSCAVKMSFCYDLQFWCQTISSDSLECPLAATVWFGSEFAHVLPVLCTWLSCSWLASSFWLNSWESGRGLTTAVQSLYNFRSHSQSFSGLCFWVTQLIRFTNVSFCSTLRVGQRERDRYELERPHRPNFTSDYGPTTGFTLNQCTVWNTRKTLWSTEDQHSASPMAQVETLFLSPGVCYRCIFRETCQPPK